MSDLITRKMLADRIAEAEDIPKAEAEACVAVVLKGLFDALSEGHDVCFRRIGRFEVVDSAERRAVNPKTREVVVIPPKKRVRFRPSRSLSTRINKMGR